MPEDSKTKSEVMVRKMTERQGVRSNEQGGRRKGGRGKGGKRKMSG